MRLLSIHFWSQNMSLRARDSSSSVSKEVKASAPMQTVVFTEKKRKRSIPSLHPLYSPFLKQLLLKHCHCIQRHKIIASWFLLVWVCFFFFKSGTTEDIKGTKQHLIQVKDYRLLVFCLLPINYN